ncbi:MAG: hypothetical protein GY800_08455, partial [Planctomycetes bacterium]|nr:hypothetical protein [Planctomycetota bacterium]
RGDTWTTSGDRSYLNIDGPVTIGAYGDCDTPDDRGICSNAPLIHNTGDSQAPIFYLHNISDWRIKDIHITGESTRGGAIGGATDLEMILLYKLKLSGFGAPPIANDHWDTDGHDQYMIVNCDVSESQSSGMFIGSERLVLMGNNMRDMNKSHVLRVWQAYKGVISHNSLSGSSINSVDGRHALKLHGPAQELINNAGNGGNGIVNPTQYVVINDNIFGTSGPWPVFIGPQNELHDERLSDIIVERNRFFSGYGTLSNLSSAVQV